MRVAHTPGPWSNDFNVEISAGMKSICGMRFPFDSEVNAANATLIAAAPELLEALTLMLYDTNGKEWKDSELSDSEWDIRFSEGKVKAHAAIAKAVRS